MNINSFFKDYIDINNKILIISFQGLYSYILENNYNKHELNVDFYDIEIPFLEYDNLTRHKDKFSIIFIRDPYQLFYLNNIEFIYNYIYEKINFLKPNKIITFGANSGGFAALYFGHLLKVDLVLSYYPIIKPFTFILNNEVNNNIRVLLKNKYLNNFENNDFDLNKIINYESKNNMIFYGNKEIFINNQIILLKNKNYNNFIYKEFDCFSDKIYDLYFKSNFVKEIILLIIDELNLIDKDKIIKKKNLHIINEYILNKNTINILGKGLTFKKIEPKENELICCVNDSVNIQVNCDFLIFIDSRTIYLLNSKVLSNVKFIIILFYNIEYCTANINTHHCLTMFNICQRSNFKGYIIPIYDHYINFNNDYNDYLNLSNWKLKYLDLLDAKIRYERSTITLLKFIFENILGYYYDDSEKKFKIKNKNILNIEFYGIAKNEPGKYIYNNLFGGGNQNNYGAHLSNLEKDLFIKMFNSINMKHKFN